jgi:hypothetical protein
VGAVGGKIPNLIGDGYTEAVRSLVPFHDRFLLTGAGFVKPWGGYLAREFWDQLISDPSLRERPNVEALLHKTTAFEDALAEMEITRPGDFGDEDRFAMRGAVLRAFQLHDETLCDNGFDAPGLLNPFVERFVRDNRTNRTVPLFTLNQDLSLERFYTGGNSPLIVVPCVYRQPWSLGGNRRPARG